ncbi:MAG: hypothetical protein WAU69_09035, partial [Solirubrobacteraceae bacterium]
KQMTSHPKAGGDRKSRRSKGQDSQQRLCMIRWIADLGALTAEALAHHQEISLASARGRLQAAVAQRLLAAERPLRDAPTLYSVTPAGMRAAGCDLEACRVTPSNARHLVACAAAAAGLARCYPDHVVGGERDLRRQERDHGARLASALLGRGPNGQSLLHRPDLVLWPAHISVGSLPLAVEVELTVKAPARLEAICRAWARCELIAGVLYLAAPEVERPLQRAIGRAQARSRVIALPLGCIPGPIDKAIPSAA